MLLEFYEDVSDGDAPAHQLALFNIRVTRICFDSWRSYTLQSLRESWYDTFSSIRDVLSVHCPVSYTYLRAHETVLELVCRLSLER